MLTLHKHAENKEVTVLVQGRKRTPVFWHPTMKEELQNDVEDLGSLNSPYLRDRYENGLRLSFL